MSRVVAVICSYWPGRVDNVVRSIEALRAGTVVPDDIIVLNNNPSWFFPQQKDVKIINSSFNAWTRGKYGAALMECADYYLLLDDDITVNSMTLKTFLWHKSDLACMSGRGIILDDCGSYWHGKDVWPYNVQVETVVDSIVGRIQFVSMESILRMFTLEPRIRLEGEVFPYEAEDILMGLANHSTVVPMTKESHPVDLPEGDMSLCASVENYAAMRDRFTLKVLSELKTQMYPAISEAPWRKKINGKNPLAPWLDVNEGAYE